MNHLEEKNDELSRKIHAHPPVFFCVTAFVETLTIVANPRKGWNGKTQRELGTGNLSWRAGVRSRG